MLQWAFKISLQKIYITPKLYRVLSRYLAFSIVPFHANFCIEPYGKYFKIFLKVLQIHLTLSYSYSGFSKASGFQNLKDHYACHAVILHRITIMCICITIIILSIRRSLCLTLAMSDSPKQAGNEWLHYMVRKHTIV